MTLVMGGFIIKKTKYKGLFKVVCKNGGVL